MSVIDGIVDASFKTGEDGSPLFYPWGILGRGYVIPNARRKEQIQVFLRRYTLIGLTVTVVVGLAAMAVMMFASWWGGIALWLALLAAALIGGAWVAAQLTRGLERTPTRLTFGEGYTNAARSLSQTALWLLEFISLALVALSVIAIAAFLSDGRSPWFYGSAGAVGVLVFAAGAVMFGLMLYAKARQPVQPARKGKAARH